MLPPPPTPLLWIFLSSFHPPFVCLSRCYCVDVNCVSIAHFQGHNEDCVHNLKTNHEKQPFVCMNHQVNHGAWGAQSCLASEREHHYPPFKASLSQWFVNRAENNRKWEYLANGGVFKPGCLFLWNIQIRTSKLRASVFAQIDFPVILLNVRKPQDFLKHYSAVL